MLDLTNYNVDVNIPITRAEYEERERKGLIKIGEKIRVIENSGNIVTYITILPPEAPKPRGKYKKCGNENDFFKLPL